MSTGVIIVMYGAVAGVAIYLYEKAKYWISYGHLHTWKPSQKKVQTELITNDVLVAAGSPAMTSVEVDMPVYDMREYDQSGWLAMNFVYSRPIPEWFIDKWVPDLQVSAAEQLIIDQLSRYNVWWEREISFTAMPLTEKGANYRFDFLLPAHSVVIEYHGKNYHKNPEKLKGDKLKEQFCIQHRIEYITYSGRDYYHMEYEIKELMDRFRVYLK